ncbi:MAG: hypothetical protein JWQ45_3194 [Blastococcus sp.]|jgi:hypothetical protein|nr:hypothetical protein [Blastococcus sp.]
MNAPRLQPAVVPGGRRGGRSLNSRVVTLAAFALSFILIALLVVTSSRAAFVAQNDNIANSVSSATVDLTDNDGTTAMFNVTGLVPGVSQVRCIQVTYTGNIDPAAVRLYRSSVPTNDLAPYLNLTVEAGAMPAGTAFSGCAGFTPTATEFNGTLDGFATTRTSYGDAATVTTWDPAGNGEIRTFRFTVSVQDVPAAEGKSTTFGFSWETRTS